MKKLRCLYQFSTFFFLQFEATGTFCHSKFFSLLISGPGSDLSNQGGNQAELCFFHSKNVMKITCVYILNWGELRAKRRLPSPCLQRVAFQGTVYNCYQHDLSCGAFSQQFKFLRDGFCNMLLDASYLGFQRFKGFLPLCLIPFLFPVCPSLGNTGLDVLSPSLSNFFYVCSSRESIGLHERVTGRDGC